MFLQLHNRENRSMSRPVHSMRLLMRSSLALAAALTIAVPAAAQQQLPRPQQLPPPGPPQAAPQRPGPGGPGAPPQAQQQQPPAPAPIKPYRALAVTMPTPVNDPSFDAFRKQLADVAAKKDRNALARLVVAQGFFWDGENGDKADKKKPSVANLEQALGGFSGRDAQGWEMLGQAAQDPTLEPLQDHAGVMCGPAGPNIDEKAFEELVKATGTDGGDWAFTTMPNLEARSGPQPNAPVVERLPLILIRVLPDQQPPPNAQQNPPTSVRVVLPSGKTAYVSIEGLSPIGFDQLCYLKDASGWKIAGYESAQ
jgi:hypothetical protein